MAWGLFLVMLGGALFLSNIAPEGLWSIGVGLIMLGLNAARYFNKIRMSGFTTVLGILSVIGGIVQLLGVRNLEGAFLLIILGAFLILKPWFDKHQLFGKAEQS
jgi:MFS superfamily sulfate permease-like transporter